MTNLLATKYSGRKNGKISAIFVDIPLKCPLTPLFVYVEGWRRANNLLFIVSLSPLSAHSLSRSLSLSLSLSIYLSIYIYLSISLSHSLIHSHSLPPCRNDFCKSIKTDLTLLSKTLAIFRTWKNSINLFTIEGRGKPYQPNLFFFRNLVPLNGRIYAFEKRPHMQI